MPLQSINFPAGIQKENTNYSSEGSWFDADKVRFKSGRPERIGGWVKHVSNTLDGVGRSVLVWRANNGTVNTAYGTHKKLYVEQGGALNDITPIRKTVNPAAGNTLNSTASSKTITVTDSAHGGNSGDYVTLSAFTMGSSGVATAELNANHSITVLTVNTYTITLATAATTTAAFGGTVGIMQYEVSIGNTDEEFEYGWGTGPWGSSTWGTPRSSSSITLAPRIWSLDTYGEDLVCTYGESKLYLWDFSGGTSARATAVTNAPTQNNLVLVSNPDRHIVTLGSHDGTAFDALLVRWSSQENPTDWTASSTNTAGSQRLSGGSKIVGAKRAQGQVLVWTDTDLHSMQFTGPPFTFGFQQIASQCGAAGPNSMVVSNSVAYWIGQHNFYMYDGSVKALPSPVRRYVFDNLNLQQRSKIVAGLNQEFQEVWWFYPSGTATENDSYVIFNYAEGAWSIGSIDRTAWVDREVYNLPIALKSTGEIYNHEQGDSDDGSAMNAFIESAEFDLGEGDELFLMSRIIPDITQDTGTIDVTFNAKLYPHDATTTYGPYTVSNSTEKVDTRVRARQMSIKFSSNSATGDRWRIGTPRIDIKPAGRR
jgi:hypothetical protein